MCGVIQPQSPQLAGPLVNCSAGEWGNCRGVDGCRECPFSHTECTACQLGYAFGSVGQLFFSVNDMRLVRRPEAQGRRANPVLQFQLCMAMCSRFFNTGSAIPVFRTVATVRHRPSYNPVLLVEASSPDCCRSSGLHGCDDCIAGFGLDKITMEPES